MDIVDSSLAESHGEVVNHFLREAETRARQLCQFKPKHKSVLIPPTQPWPSLAPWRFAFAENQKEATEALIWGMTAHRGKQDLLNPIFVFFSSSQQINIQLTN